jgi:hypothetical protein
VSAYGSADYDRLVVLVNVVSWLAAVIEDEHPGYLRRLSDRYEAGIEHAANRPLARAVSDVLAELAGDLG